MKYHFLDLSSAWNPVFSTRLDDPQSRIIVGDIYFSEFSQAEPDRIEKHFVRLQSFGDRLYYGTSATECLNREIATLRRTPQSFVIDSTATVWMRRNLGEPRSLAKLISQPEMRRTVIEDRYSNQDSRDRYKVMVRTYEHAMKITKHNVPSATPLDEAMLIDTVKIGRYSVFKYLKDLGRSESDSYRFAMKDSYMIRDICSRLCRIADWAQSKGITGQNSAQLDNEGIDVEYVVMASYCDEFLTADLRNQRNDKNLRRLLMLAPGVRKMRSA